jgi:hypothetical protein
VPIGAAPADIAAVLLKPETKEQLASAPYLQAVVNESMRLYPAGGAASNRCDGSNCALPPSPRLVTTANYVLDMLPDFVTC